MSSFAEDLTALTPHPRAACHACRLLGELKGDELVAFAAALDSGLAARKISHVARAHGQALPSEHVLEHRNKKHAA